MRRGMRGIGGRLTRLESFVFRMWAHEQRSPQGSQALAGAIASLLGRTRLRLYIHWKPRGLSKEYKHAAHGSPARQTVIQADLRRFQPLPTALGLVTSRIG